MRNKGKRTYGRGTASHSAPQLTIAFLRSRDRCNSDALGTFAGRLKRRWILERRRDDADESLALYRAAYEETKDRDPKQAFYHGINIGFLELAYHENAHSSRLTHCEEAARDEQRPDPWRLATEGETHLLLGDNPKALKCYRAALATNPQPWQIDSMSQQASLIVGLVGDEPLAEELDAVFRKGG